MTDRVDITLKLANQATYGCTVEVERLEQSWRLVLHSPLLGQRSYENRDQFEALGDMRRDLARDGTMVLCAGARRDVYPSGMSRDMGGGRKAYVLRPGEEALETIDIFAEAPPALLGSVEDQRSNYERWLKDMQRLRHEKVQGSRNGPSNRRRFFGACMELALFSVALLLTLPVIASERAGFNVNPVPGPVIFGLYCFVGWRRAKRSGWLWAAKAVIFAAFVLVFAAMVGSQLP